MSKTTYPVFGEMLPKADDIQLIVDAFKTEDRKRLTVDGIFNPGIVNNVDDYVQPGTNPNTLKIIPFIAYTRAGNRIEVLNTYDFLTAQSDGSITIDEELNIPNREKNIPYWYHYSKDYTNFADASAQTYKILITKLRPSSILQGIKMKHTVAFTGCGEVYVSIGTESEPEKFTPKFLLSDTPRDNNIETSNVLYSESGANYVPVYAYFTCSLSTLNFLTSGSLSISLCITNVSNVDYDEEDTDGGIPLVNVKGEWKPNITYYIVARYITEDSDLRSINIHNDDVDIDTTPFYARQTDSFKFLALRRTGSSIDTITDNDVKLGRVVSDQEGNITIYTNSYNAENKTFDTEYLTLPGVRFRDFAYEDIQDYIKDKVSKTGDTMTGNLTMSNAKRIEFLGQKKYSIGALNGQKQFTLYSSDGRGLNLNGNDDQPCYFNGELSFRLLHEGDSVANQDLSNLSNTGLEKFVAKTGDTMTGALFVVSPALSSDSTQVSTTAWVRSLLAENGGMTTYRKSADGFYKFTNGLILQWGSVTANFDTRLRITLPTPFTNVAYRVMTQNYNTGVASSGANQMATTIYAQATTYFDIFLQRVDNKSVSQSQITEWFAIGF